MNSLSIYRMSFVLIASLLVLASCGSDDDSASSTPSTSTPATSTEVEAETPVESTTTTTTPGDDTTATTIDNRTAEEAAIDDLDLMMFQLGVTDLEGTANCVIERLDSEGIELTGEGTSELIALSACDESIISMWLPSTNPALPADTWTCTVQSIGDWIDDLSIPDAEAFLSAAQPPADFVELTASACDASAEDIAAALS